MLQATYQQLTAWDQAHLWHPFTQMKDYCAVNPLIIERGEGIKLYDMHGKAYYDGFSSVWLNVHGHNVAELNEAVTNQLSQVAHTTLLGMSNIPAIELGAKLAEIAPRGLRKIFYSDSGATGVEIALKMAFQYWSNRGDGDKHVFITMKGAYHGDTIGAVSVGAIPLYHETFRPMLFPTYTIPYPNVYRHPKGEAGAVEDTLAALHELLDQHEGEVAALIIEPIVQAASGIMVMPQGCLDAIAKLCRECEILLIADEVATGFGRTGAMFACHLEQVCPDIMVVGKGLTGGYLPVAATLTTDEIYEAFCGEYEDQLTFFHGHSYTGNPLGCAVALASLRLMEERKLVEGVRDKAAHVSCKLAELTDRPYVGDIRQQGLIVGIELVSNKKTKQPYEWTERIGMRVSSRARELGMLTRPLGNVVVFIPPLVSNLAELDSMMDILIQAIIDVTERGWTA